MCCSRSGRMRLTCHETLLHIADIRERNRYGKGGDGVVEVGGGSFVILSFTSIPSFVPQRRILHFAIFLCPLVALSLRYGCDLTGD